MSTTDMTWILANIGKQPPGNGSTHLEQRMMGTSTGRTISLA